MNAPRPGTLWPSMIPDRVWEDLDVEVEDLILQPPATEAWERRGLLYMPAPRPRVLQAVDLFSGCGGFSLGMHQAGINVIAAVEWDPWAAITYLTNLGSRAGCAISYVIEDDRARFNKALKKCGETQTSGWIGKSNPDRNGGGCRAFVIGDVSKLSAAFIQETLAGIGIRDLPIDIVFGGPPCQGFSRAGRQDPVDPRNNLVLEFWRLADEIGASTVAMENVPPLMTEKKFRPLFDAMVKRANDAGFTVVANVLDACNFGVPQYRRRTFVVGTRGEAAARPVSLPMPTHWPFIAAPGKKRVQIGHIAEQLSMDAGDAEPAAADEQLDMFPEASP